MNITATSNRLLLLDGDVFCFIAAAAVQKDVTYEDGMVYRWSDHGEGRAVLDNLVSDICARLGTKEYLFFLTDPEVNWRHQVMPTYKANRSGGGERPQLLTFLKDYALTKHSAIRWPGMEADDLMGIWSTSLACPVPQVPALPEEIAVFLGEGLVPVIVSKDKDMRGIPGWFYNMNRLKDPLYEGPELISEEAADWWHLVQTLAGDKVDGYDGCPTIGLDRAKVILEEKLRLVPEEGYITRGPRKGQRTVKWVGEPCDNLWSVVVSNYEKQKMTEADALQTARVARICRVEDYDFERNMVILWEPDE